MASNGGGGGGLRHSNSSRLSRMSYSGSGGDDTRVQAAVPGDRPMVTFARRTHSGRYLSYSRDDLDSDLGIGGDMSPDRKEEQQHQYASYHRHMRAPHGQGHRLGGLPPADGRSHGKNGGSVKALAAAGGRVFSAHQDGRVRVWRVSRRSRSENAFKLVAALPTARDYLGRVFRQANYVQTMARRSHRCLWIKHADSISCLAVAATVHNTALLYSGSWDRTLKDWRIADLKCLEYIRAHDDAVNAVAAGAGVVYSGSANRRVKAWEKGKASHFLQGVLVARDGVSWDLLNVMHLNVNVSFVVRYDAIENQLTADISHLMKILRRRYYLVEKAKDANIIGILVGTLGVAGCLHIIEQMKELIKAAGKKSYTLVMGRPNSAKLVNFPECEVFIYVSCAQTALLDSKDFLALVITPFEAVLAFGRGREWTGEYLLDFKDLITLEKHGPPTVDTMDILRFHAVYWPAMLMSAGLSVPDTVFCHGFLTKDGMKMGKSLGNMLEPKDLVERFGADAVRYFFLREVEFGNDGDYLEERFINIVNAHLANTIGIST
ncbi:unnamed protein product [Miscanthus lutarioriparius]|uniref:Methionyl/Leucyl tRNA synthetase domain-containing protein n=1 Tax=Miscanthus lutarioriparius TaxID=422564 RepID=A0A811R293_9POAL|nr:unnamed protein product [Miscanthus lutarioriparius]